MSKYLNQIADKVMHTAFYHINITNNFILNLIT